MLIKTIVVGVLETNCYVFGSKGGEVAVIDPGDEAEKIIEYVNENGCSVKHIILTHGHADHIGAVRKLKTATGAEVLIHESDAECLTNARKNLSAYMIMPCVQPPADRLLRDGDIIKVGDCDINVIHTPGHTPGSICLRAERMLFSGDTLFRESVGRTDLPGSSRQDLLDSIVSKLMLLDDDIRVYPGHMEATSIGHERSNNPFITRGK